MREVKGCNTDFGFVFGSIEVMRTASNYKGAAIISIETPKVRLSIKASKTGVLSFYDEQGNRCNLVSCTKLKDKQAEIDTADELHFDECAELRAEISRLNNIIESKRVN